MSGEGNPGWGNNKSHVENEIRIRMLRAKWQAERTFNQIKYHLNISDREHNEESKKSDLFMREALDFISDNPSGRLQPLHISVSQLSVFLCLKEAINSGTLRNTSTRGGFDVYGCPPILKIFERNTPDEKATLCTFWPLKNSRRPSFRINGLVKNDYIEDMAFKLLPGKLINSIELRKMLGDRENHGRVKNTLITFNKGNAWTNIEEYILDGMVMTDTEKYYFLGSYESDIDGRILCLYGSNNAQNGSNESVPEPQRKFVHQRVENE